MSYHSVKSEDTNLASDDDSILYKDGSDIQQRSAWKFSKSRKPQLNTILQVLVVIETLVIIFLAATSMTTLRATLRQQEMLNAQYSTEDPHHLPTTYGRDRRYMTLDSKYDHLWKDWTADAQVAVPGELPGEDKIQAGYSMFHQMHCLASMRRAIQAARAGEDPGVDYFDNGHWPHCLDYLRKSILCWADDTLEVARVVDGKRLPYIDGSSTVRQCRSPDLMFQKIRLDEKAVEKLNREDGLDHEREGQAEHLAELSKEADLSA